MGDTFFSWTVGLSHFCKSRLLLPITAGLGKECMPSYGLDKDGMCQPCDDANCYWARGKRNGGFPERRVLIRVAVRDHHGKNRKTIYTF